MIAATAHYYAIQNANPTVRIVLGVIFVLVIAAVFFIVVKLSKK